MNIGKVISLAQKAHLRAEMEIFLAYLLGCTRLDLIAKSEEEVPVEKLSDLQKGWIKIQDGFPVAYLTHEKEFFGINLYVDESVLIPRPCTEGLVTLAMEMAERNVLEIGTGSGAIAIALAKARPALKITATDVSSAALQVANKNCVQCGVNVRLIESDLLEEVPHENFDTLVANLPYIGSKEHAFVEEKVKKHEPHLALSGGEDGLQLYEKLFEQTHDWNSRDNQNNGFKHILCEIGFSQGEAILALAQKLLPEFSCEVKQDGEGLDRYFLLERK